MFKWLTSWMSKTTHPTVSRFVSSFLILGLGVSVFIASEAFQITKLVEELEWKTYDLRALLQQGENANQPSQDVVILKFDDPTLNSFEAEYGTWPWPRQVHKEIITWLNGAQAKTIAYDIMFIASRKGEEASDQALVNAFRQYPNVYISLNLDNNQQILKQLGKTLSPKEYEDLRPIAVNLDNQLQKAIESEQPLENPVAWNRGAGFYDGLIFSNYRKILPGLLDPPTRIGIVNHIRNKDGVSRSNPLLFQLFWKQPIISPYKPYQKEDTEAQWLDEQGNPHRERWKDQRHQWVDESGCLLEPSLNLDGQRVYRCKTLRQSAVYPYLGLRVALDHRWGQHKTMPISLNPAGQLVLDSNPKHPWIVPLDVNGAMLIRWYNVNLDQKTDVARAQKLSTQEKKLTAQIEDPKTPPAIKTLLAKERYQLHEFQAQLNRQLKQYYPPKPYKEVSVWQVLQAIQHEKTGEITAKDQALKALFKHKTIFIGTTAVSTYDIKTTPISRVIPGVLLQAMVYDNLIQNKGYMHRASPGLNWGITGLLCILATIAIFKLRSAVGGLTVVLALAIIYLSATIYVYHHHYLWLNIAAPLMAMTIMTIITFMIKYINRDQDYEKTYELATTDAMTGLKNHRYFQEHLKSNLANSQKLGTSFSLILIDIDYFKKFNDTYGHQAGDEVLRAVALKLQRSVRSNDMVARYGGEEMAVILDKANVDEAVMVAQKLVSAVAEEAYPIAEGTFKHVTISAGVATYPQHGQNAQELIEFSDKGLYRAKEGGRNQVGSLEEAPAHGE